MKIRTATTKDKVQVMQLFDEFSAFFGTEDVPSEVGETIFDQVVRRDDIKLFVAEEDGQLLGLATLYLLPNIRHGYMRGHIEDFFVTQNTRSNGVGTKIFDGVKEYCRAHHIKVIKLDSGNELADAHFFYEKNGGKTTERFFRFDLN